MENAIKLWNLSKNNIYVIIMNNEKCIICKKTMGNSLHKKNGNPVHIKCEINHELFNNKKCKMGKLCYDKDCYNCKYVKDCLDKL